MSNHRKHRKFTAKSKTTTVISVKPKKRMGTNLPKVNIMNCYPPNKFKVVSQPAKWDRGGLPFAYLNRIGQCVGTERIYGAKLKFESNEIICIPFENLEAVNSVTPSELSAKNKQTQNLPVVAQEVELVKGNYYKLVRKPTSWNESCKYVGETGKCLLVDDRGARLRFADGNDISFQADVLEAAPAIDLSNVIPHGELDEKDIVHGGLYQIIKAPEKFGAGHQLLGKVGKAKWPNYRGVCIKFADSSSYVIPYDCLAKYVPPMKPNPVPVAKELNAGSIVIHRKYKVKSVPGDWKEHEKRYAVGQFAEVLGATDIQKMARVRFDNKLEKMIPFTCLEDLPRPSEDELIALIKKHPTELLRIIKQINQGTRLKPVQDFCSKGLLPYNKDGTPAPEAEVYGPQMPSCHSAALIAHTTIGEASDDMMERVVSLFKADEAKAVNPADAPISPTEVAAEE